jgi:hypothetical protein
MACENCEGSNDGSYGSGRFCSQKCARGFATKQRREAINRQVSLKLRGRIVGGAQFKPGPDKRRAKLYQSGFFSSAAQSKRRKDQIAAETAMAQIMTREGFKIYPPSVVCDRVAVKDGKVFFVEFKKHSGQKLRPGQQEVHDLVPDMYLIRFEDAGVVELADAVASKAIDRKVVRVQVPPSAPI